MSSLSGKAWKDLMKILDNEETVKELLTLPRDALNDHQRVQLRKLCEHFGVSTHRDQQAQSETDGSSEDDDDDDNDDDDDDVGDDGHNRSGGRAAGQKSRKPGNPRAWKRLLTLESLECSVEVHNLLRIHRSDPHVFLDDHRLLLNEVSRFDRETVGDAFMACYTYTLRVEGRHEMDHLRWCFITLLYHDICRLIRPKGSTRVTDQLLLKVKRFLGPVMTDDVQADRMLERFRDWSRCGQKLNVLVTEFGAGSPFFLVNELSKDFLRNKLTMNGKGASPGWDHLRKLGLAEKAQKSGANELGKRIREVLIRPFREAYL